MRDLVCHHCAHVLVADFWNLFEAETVPMFSSFSLTCPCGAQVHVLPLRRYRWLRVVGEERRLSA